MSSDKRTFFVGGNWKCNGSLDSIKSLMESLNASKLPNDVEIVVAPPYVYLQYVKQLASDKIQVAAQNSWLNESGAYTGEVSPTMIKDIGVNWTILGHSERRSINKETDEDIGKKTGLALKAGLSVILCVGETETERKEDRTNEVIVRQLEACKPFISDWSRIVIAYEPVWAIGTGNVATPEQAQEVHNFIRKWIKENVSEEVSKTTRIIYGGSVKPNNCVELAKLPDVDGFLVGGASLVSDQFVPIINSNSS